MDTNCSNLPSQSNAVRLSRPPGDVRTLKVASSLLVEEESAAPFVCAHEKLCYVKKEEEKEEGGDNTIAMSLF